MELEVPEDAAHLPLIVDLQLQFVIDAFVLVAPIEEVAL